MDNLINEQLKFISALYVTFKVFIFLLLIVLFISFYNSPLQDKIELRKVNKEYSTSVAKLKIDIATLEKEILDLQYIKENLINNVNAQKEKSTEFNSYLIDNVNTINTLIDKYQYPLEYSKKNPNADFGLSELVLLNDLCTKYNIPIEIMLAIYEKESSFCSYAKNPTSTATGYGQLIDSTAKSIYENYLKFGKYDISNHRTICVDKSLNIQLSCRLMKYNIDTYGSYWSAVERYYGHKDKSLCYEYAKDISDRMKKYGSSLK